SDFVRNPVGTGPYRLVREETNLNSKIVWEKNPTYRDAYYPTEGMPEDKKEGLLADAGKKLPLNDRVIVRIFVESQPMWLEFLNGNLERSAIPKDSFSQAITPTQGLAPEFEEKGIVLRKGALMDV